MFVLLGTSILGWWFTKGTLLWISLTNYFILFQFRETRLILWNHLIETSTFELFTINTCGMLEFSVRVDTRKLDSASGLILKFKTTEIVESKHTHLSPGSVYLNRILFCLTWICSQVCPQEARLRNPTPSSHYRQMVFSQTTVPRFSDCLACCFVTCLLPFLYSRKTVSKQATFVLELLWVWNLCFPQATFKSNVDPKTVICQTKVYNSRDQLRARLVWHLTIAEIVLTK